MMEAQNAAPTPQVEAIHGVVKYVDAMRAPARWVGRTGKLYIVVVGGTVLAEPLVEMFLGRPIDRAIAPLFEQVLLIPLISAALWWGREHGRFKEALYKLRRVLKADNTDARQVVPASSIGPLLEVTMAAGGTLPTGEDQEIASATALLGALLPSIRAEDELVFTLEQRKRLHELVRPGGQEYWATGAGGVCGKNTSLFLSLCHKLRPGAISALGILGDSSSVPVLERFARRTKDAALRASALHSIEQIRERFPYGSEQMLRAAAAPQLPDTLLRPAAADKSQNSEPQQLLRADTSDSELRGG